MSIYQIVISQTLILNTLRTYHAGIHSHPVTVGTDTSSTRFAVEERITITGIMTAVWAYTIRLLIHPR